MALAAMTANAQTKEIATISTPKSDYVMEPMFCVSANGNYAAGDQGAVTLLDLNTGEASVFYEEENDGSFAKAVTNDGTIIGQYGNGGMDSPAAILKKGAKQWEYLPVPEGCNATGTAPQGATADGKYLVGYAASDGTYPETYVPVIWTLQDDGKYTVEVMPRPEKDIWGSVPQFTMLFGISNDGNTAYGRTVDWTGFSTLGIIYKKDAEGKWSFKTVGEDWLIIGDENPGPQPTFESIVTAEEGTEEYYEQIAQLDQAIMDWWPKAEAYAHLSSAPTNQIRVNANSISGNGKYVVLATPSDGVRRYNTEDFSFVPVGGGSISCSVTDYGDVVTASGFDGMYSAYITPNGEDMSGGMSLLSWVQANYDTTIESGEKFTGGTEGMGITCCTPDGKTFVGYCNPRQEGMWSVSTIVRIGKGPLVPTSIQDVMTMQQPEIENGTLNIPEGVGEVSIYGTDGTQVASFTAEGSVNLSSYASGMSIVKVKVGKLTKTFKVNL